MAIDFLWEVGCSLYQEGKYDQAMDEFRKILLVDPEYSPAAEYIQKIQRQISQEPASLYPQEGEKAQLDAARAFLDRFTAPRVPVPSASEPSPASRTANYPVATIEEIVASKVQPVELQQGQGILLKHGGIQRFLSTQPGILAVERRSPDELSVSAQQLGYTYFYVWDTTDTRWTMEFSVVPARPAGISLEESQRASLKRAADFTFDYSTDWSVYANGPDFEGLERSTYAYIHSLGLRGPTPYGELDASVVMTAFPKEVEMSSLTVGIEHGHFGPFDDFSVRGFDIFAIPPKFSNLAFPGPTLRGGMLSSPAFHHRLSYTLFYGREEQTGSPIISPLLSNKKDAYVQGVNVTFTPDSRQEYRMTLVEGWGTARPAELNQYGYDFQSHWKFLKGDLSYEIASDSQKLAQIARASYRTAASQSSLEFRSVDKQFYSIIGSGWRQGEQGFLFTHYYSPSPRFDMNTSIDVYQDRLYPAEEDPNRLNQDVYWNAEYRFTPETTLRMAHTFQNYLGKISPYRYQNTELSLNAPVAGLRTLFASLQAFHQENTNYSFHQSDYLNDRLQASLRFSLSRDLTCYVQKELNWLQERFTAGSSRPNAFETGIEWSNRFSESLWRGTLRVTYRDEQDTSSPLSFLAGEDYIETYGEISYRPNNDIQLYMNARLREVRPERSAESKRFEASVNAGIRCVWDTGVSWQPNGTVEGYVFKDVNFDGVRQPQETPFENVALWIDPKRKAVTDANGYYRFKSVRGQSASVRLDTDTIPEGYIPTVPAVIAVSLEGNRTMRVDFGIAARSEISGFIFEDIDGNGTLSSKDKGISGVAVILDDGTRSFTDDSGRYVFSQASPGVHTVSIDLTTLPVEYLPAVPVKQDITLQEGTTYYLSFPVRKQ